MIGASLTLILKHVGKKGAPGAAWLEDCSIRDEPGLCSLQKRHFVDHRRVLVRGGRGGDGVSCFHSEPRKEFGGPDGGDGGNGGHIILRGRCSEGQLGQDHCVCTCWGRKFPPSHPDRNLNSEVDVWASFLLNYVNVYI